MTIRKLYKRLSDCMCTFLAASLEELITRDPQSRPMRTLVQNKISGIEVVTPEATNILVWFGSLYVFISP